MHNIFKMFTLQFFADGADGAGEGASTGETAVAAGQPSGESSAAAEQTAQTQESSLESLGVPKSKAEKYRAIKAKKGERTAAPAVTAAPQGNKAEQEPAPAQQAAAATEPTQQPTTMDWDELMKNPEYNRRMQDTVKAAKKSSQDRLDSLAPVLELLGKAYNMDTSDINKLDVGALTQAIQGDDHFYENMAIDMGIDVDEAKKAVQRDIQQNARERDLSNREAALQNTVEQMAVQQHIAKLERDSAELKKVYPQFDLKEELKNPRFARMVSPSGGLSVAEAYNAMHYKEIQEAKAAEATRNAQRAYANSIKSGRGIPAENGTTSRTSPAVSNKRYSDMNKEEREIYVNNLKRDPHARLK